MLLRYQMRSLPSSRFLCVFVGVAVRVAAATIVPVVDYLLMMLLALTVVVLVRRQQERCCCFAATRVNGLSCCSRDCRKPAV